MKKVRLLLLVAIPLFGARSVTAQTDIKLEDLKMPNSPAFILLDVAPTSIDRPTTTKAFSTSILNNVNKNNGIPQNYAVEFTPYWFFKHPNLSAFKYWGYNKDKAIQKIGSQAKYLSVSFATVNSTINAATGTNYSNMSVGVRSTLLNRRKNSDITELIEKNKEHQTRLKKINNDNIEKTAAEVAEIADSDPTLKQANKEINDILNRKPGLALDLAAASSWAFDDTNYNSGRFNRAGAWLTFSYTPNLNKKNNLKEDYLSMYLTSRYLNDKNNPDGNGELVLSEIFDNGGKIELEIDRFALSYEYLYRLNFKNDALSSFRSSGLLKYSASDKISITAAFGRNFGDTNNLITQISINWGINGGNTNLISQ